jgi:hypothetical protein
MASTPEELTITYEEDGIETVKRPGQVHYPALSETQW